MAAALAVGWASTSAAQTGGQATDLPTAVTSMLDARFPGWSIAPASEDSMAEWRSGSRHIPNVERGDYDGNGVLDYALAVAYPRRGAAAAGEPRVDVVLFLQRGRSYSFMPISSDVGPPIEIRANAKGERIHEYGEDRSFVLTRDAFTVSPGHAGPCYTFVYLRGRFESHWTCD
jgi:hypothetical protein